MAQLDNSLPPGLAGFMATRQFNQNADTANLGQMSGITGILAKLQAAQREQEFREALASGDTQRLAKIPGGLDALSKMAQLKEHAIKLREVEKKAAFYSPDNLAKFTTGATPAEPEIPQGLDELGGGPGRAAVAENPGQLDFGRFLQSAAAQGVVNPETYGNHLLANETRKASIENSRAIANQNFMLNIARINMTADENKRKVLRDEATNKHNQEMERLKRMEADPFGMSGGAAGGVISPPATASPPPAVQPSPGAMQIPPEVQSRRDSQASNVVAGMTPGGGGPALPTNAVVPSVPPPSGGMLQAADTTPSAPVVPGITAPPAKGPSGEEFLKKLPPALQSEVKKYSEGRMPVPTGFALKSPYFQQLMQAVSQYDPNFSASRYQVRLDFEKGKMRDSRLAFGQALNHLGTLESLSDAMGNKDIPRLNQFINMVKQETGNPDINNFDTAKQAVGEELMRAFRQVNASEREARDWEDKFRAIKSPEQIKGAIRTAAKLLDGRLKEMNNIWDTSMGTKGGYPNIVSEEAQKAIGRFLAKDQGRRADDNPSGGTIKSTSKSGKPIHSDDGGKTWKYD